MSSVFYSRHEDMNLSGFSQQYSTHQEHKPHFQLMSKISEVNPTAIPFEHLLIRFRDILDLITRSCENRHETSTSIIGLEFQR